MRSFRRALALAAILCFSTGFAYGQRPGQQQQPRPPRRQESLSISGRVLFGRNLKEIPSVLVRLLNGSGIPMQQTFTRSRGEFEFHNLRLGQYMVEVVEEGYEVVRQTVDLFFGSRPGVMLLLEPTTQAEFKRPDPGRTVSVQELRVPRKARKAFTKGLRELNEKNRPDRSVPHFQKAIALYPKYDEAYVQLGVAHLYQGEVAAAQETLEKALAANQENARAHALLGMVYREQQHIDRSAQELQEAVTLEPSNWLAHLELAKTLLEQQKPGEALEHARQAHDLNAQSQTAHLLLYDLLVRQENYQTALDELEKFLTLHPDHPSTANMRQARDKLRAALAGRTP